jgi:hypothetical protein
MALPGLKLFFVAELCGGKAENSLETSGLEFFGEDDLPPASVAPVTTAQIGHVWTLSKSRWPTAFD